MQLNRHFLIYWIFVAIVRIILQTLLLLEIFIYNILETSPYEILYTFLEILDYGKPPMLPLHSFIPQKCLNLIFVILFPVVLITSFVLVLNLYKQLKQRDRNDFTRLENEAWIVKVYKFIMRPKNGPYPLIASH